MRALVCVGVKESKCYHSRFAGLRTADAASQLAWIARLHLGTSIFLITGIIEGILDLLAAVEGGDENEQGSACDD